MILRPLTFDMFHKGLVHGVTSLSLVTKDTDFSEGKKHSLVHRTDSPSMWSSCFDKLSDWLGLDHYQSRDVQVNLVEWLEIPDLTSTLDNDKLRTSCFWCLGCIYVSISFRSLV